MADSNIDIFDCVVGIVFAKLYASFPVRTYIDYKSLDEMQPQPDDLDWLSKYARQKTLFSSTMSWLVDAGYVWCSIRDESSGSFSDCVLTPKGLEILNLPSSLEGSSIGASLRKAVIDTSGEALKDLAKTALSKGAALVAAYGGTFLSS